MSRLVRSRFSLAEIPDFSYVTYYEETEMNADQDRIVRTLQIGTGLFLVAAVVIMACLKVSVRMRAAGRIRPLESELSIRFDEQLHIENGGRVDEVLVEEGMTVSAGQLLAKLDTREADFLLQCQHHRLRLLSGEISGLETSLLLLRELYQADLAVEEAELLRVDEELEYESQRRLNEMEKAQAKESRAGRYVQRIRHGHSRGAFSDQDLEDAELAFRMSQENTREAELPLSMAVRAVQQYRVQQSKCDFEFRQYALKRQLQAKRLEHKAAETEYQRLELKRSCAFVRAPVDGVVSCVDLKAGQVAAVGAIGISIVQVKGYQFEMNVSGRDAAHIVTGAPVQIELDAFPRHEFGVLIAGIVSSVSADSRVVADGRNGEAVYTVKVRVLQEQFGTGSRSVKVSLGMPGMAEILVEPKKSVLTLLWEQIADPCSRTCISL